MRVRSGLGLVESKVASIYPSRQSASFFVFLHVSDFETRDKTRPDQSLLADQKRDTGNDVENPHLETP